MSSAPVAALTLALTLVGVLLTSGIAKLRHGQATQDAFAALRVPTIVPARFGAAALPWTEIGLAGLVLGAPSSWLVPVAVGVLALMLAYAGLVARALGFDEPVACSCFGSIGRHEVDRTTLGRNVLLSLLAAGLVVAALDGGSVASAAADLDAGDWWALVAAAAAAAVAVLVVGSPAASEGSADLLDYARQAIPFGTLSLLGGTSSTLVELSRSQARFVVVLNPGCGPCVRIAERLDGWAAQLGPAVGVVAVYPDEAAARTASEHHQELSAWEPELNVRRVFSVGTPGAVLLGADGLVAGGPVAGERDIQDFVDDILDQLAAPS